MNLPVSDDDSRKRESSVLATVIIRNLNESAHLALVLQALSAQVPAAPRVIVVDNGSTDDSIRVAENAGAHVVHLPRAEFTYGRALNIGLAEAETEWCILLSAHSLPLGPHFVSECVKALRETKIGAARCIHLSKRKEYTRWQDPILLDRSATVDDIVSYGPLASGCAIRRSVWKQIQFDEHLTAAEDKLWTQKLLAIGYLVVSPCPAFYAYLRDLPPAEALRKNHRELLAVYDATGVRLSHLKHVRARALANSMVSSVREIASHTVTVGSRELARLRLPWK